MPGLLAQSILGVERKSICLVVLVLHRAILLTALRHLHRRVVSELRVEIGEETGRDLSLPNQIFGHVTHPWPGPQNVLSPQAVHLNFM